MLCQCLLARDLTMDQDQGWECFEAELGPPMLLEKTFLQQMAYPFFIDPKTLISRFRSFGKQTKRKVEGRYYVYEERECSKWEEIKENGGAVVARASQWTYGIWKDAGKEPISNL